MAGNGIRFVVKRLLVVAVFLAMGGLACALVAVGATQFCSQPLASLSGAKQRAIRSIMQGANPTPPIWPTFHEENWGVTVRTTYPGDMKLQRTSGPYIIVHVECGWPWRCLAARSFYMPGGWRDQDAVIKLPLRRSASGRFVQPELPLRFIWTGFALNSIVFALVIAAPIVLPLWLRRWHRMRKNRCARCGYPRGESDVCTECGSSLQMSRR
jgi:hypothetical protein